MKKSLRANSWKLLHFQNCSHKSLTIKTIITCWRISNLQIINVSHLDFALKGWELQAYQGQGHRAKSWVISLSFFILLSFVFVFVLGFCICICICIGIHITRSLGKVLGNVIIILFIFIINNHLQVWFCKLPPDWRRQQSYSNPQWPPVTEQDYKGEKH